MTDADKKTMLQSMSGETDQAVLTTYLSLAANKVIQRAYPFDTSITVVPDRYAINQVEIANFLLAKRGAEGQTYHGENGIVRTYSGGDVPAEMLKDIIPMVGVV